ncbi:hypothetical protein [Pseudoalteromonas rubra]|uniref:hypothetical protein n=1 Tax=Pseudoalteromonas rubra TaxID=43658 RepID=UPI002DB995BE|nr:hypothetical protein [Pseudoalteromonas rubra]MEC4091908.1 hypothetical protein [Pseudoalteromonas rubra]
MAISVKVHEAFFSGHFVLNDNLDERTMLHHLGKNDPQGVILDEVDGNVKGAFCVFLGQRLYECKQITKVKLGVNFTTEFTNRFDRIARLYQGDDQPWDFKLLEYMTFPTVKIEEAEVAA